MARITTVASARASKKSRVCMRCREDITVGQSYQWVQANRYAPRLNKHTDCSPGFKPSEYTSSKIATAYAGQEAAHDALDALDVEQYRTDDTDTVFDAESFMADVQAALDEAATGAQECAADYQDGLDAMPEGLQYGDVGSEIQEKIDTLESYESDVQSFDYTGDAWSDMLDAVKSEHEPEADDESDDDGLDDTDTLDDELLDAISDAWNEWTQGVLDEAREAVDALEL